MMMDVSCKIVKYSMKMEIKNLTTTYFKSCRIEQQPHGLPGEDCPALQHGWAEGPCGVRP